MAPSRREQINGAKEVGGEEGQVTCKKRCIDFEATGCQNEKCLRDTTANKNRGEIFGIRDKKNNNLKMLIMLINCATLRGVYNKFLINVIRYLFLFLCMLAITCTCLFECRAGSESQFKSPLETHMEMLCHVRCELMYST